VRNRLIPPLRKSELLKLKVQIRLEELKILQRINPNVAEAAGAE
jgi:hypothetical protein